MQKPLDKEKIDRMLADVLRVLGKEDTLRLFYLAWDGFRSGEEIKNKLSLTSRRYFRRLRDLVDANLVKKDEVNNTYELTLIGKILYETLFNDVSPLLPNADLVEKIRELGAPGGKTLTHLSFSVDNELTEITRRLAFHRANVHVVTEYEDLVKAIIFQIQRAETQILLASKYYDVKIWEHLARAIERGVSIYNILDMKIDIPRIVLQLTEFLKEPGINKMYRNMITSPLLQYRFMKLPFSFMIIDGTDSFLEFSMPERKEFFSAVFVESKDFAQQLEKTFMLHWETAHKLPQADRFVKKIREGEF